MTRGSLEGCVALVTGANTGIGRVTALELARRGARVIVGVRSLDKVQPLAAEVAALGCGSIVPLPLELGDFAAIRAFAASVLARREPLHILINNAGVAGARGMTASGFERTFGVNHIGTFLLTRLLTEHMVRTAAAGVQCRVVTVASRVHARCKRFGYEGVRKPTRFTGVTEYQHSKLANLLFSAELARRLIGTGVNAYSLHPGVVATDIWRAVPWPVRSLMKLRPSVISAQKGAMTTLYCATSASAAAETGLYYESERVKAPSLLAQDAELAAELWWRSERWVA